MIFEPIKELYHYTMLPLWQIASPEVSVICDQLMNYYFFLDRDLKGSMVVYENFLVVLWTEHSDRTKNKIFIDSH